VLCANLFFVHDDLLFPYGSKCFTLVASLVLVVYVVIVLFWIVEGQNWAVGIGSRQRGGGFSYGVVAFIRAKRQRGA
jgi:hypothetical protein